MTTKIEYSIPRQESQSRVPVAVFTLSQVPKESLSRIEQGLARSQPKVPVPVIESPEVQPSTIASKLRPEPAKTKIEVTPVSPSPSQYQVPHILSAFTLVSSSNPVSVSPNAKTKSIFSLRSSQIMFRVLSTLLALILSLILLSDSCFARAPSHRTHRARYRKAAANIAKFSPKGWSVDPVELAFQ
ncbi:hypothetical protein K503DRAFT_806064 [Rhizopogon vinicolor AM-OR11-026]|uniref:Uncharacterized protein n=1 Tax=Rhizopogon vinicolor AM-OR11-026 TaxID=1314800 RepID=A0A1B7MFS0_9AGAM|nr:hypothetical protein K503DRAFT_806064 [Rhizopogon vinicolor AM-OR11-026]